MFQRAVNSRVGRTENAQFLEHFRYVIVASQLLNEYPDLGSLHTAPLRPRTPDTASGPLNLESKPVNITGVVVTISLALAVVLLMHWVRGAKINKTRVLVALLCIAVAGIIFYARIRRQWLKHLRQQAVESVSDLTTNVKGFELTSTAALSLIQEVELVSKGYRLCVDLARIIQAYFRSNIEQKHPTAAHISIRRCQRQSKVRETAQIFT